MKFAPLVWAMLWRSRTRTLLTAFSIAVAFFLFGLLQTVLVVFSLNVKVANAENLYVTSRTGAGQPLPMAYRERIAAVPGVVAVTPVIPMRTWYQDPKNELNATALDLSYFGVDPRFVLPKEQREASVRGRATMIVGHDIAEQNHWHLGDRVPLQSSMPKTDGSTTWVFEVTGIFEFNPQLMGKVPTLNVFPNAAYVEEARLFDKGQVFLYVLRIKDPAQADAIGAAIDALFRNSGAETRTQTESMFNVTQASELADVGLIVHGILAAVFFTLALVAGNTMVRAFRERVPELAVLKTLGFGDGQAAGLMLAEALLLAVGAAGLGLGVAVALVPATLGAIGVGNLGDFGVEGGTVAAGLGLAALLGIGAAAIPAWQARRLSVIAALAGE